MAEKMFMPGGSEYISDQIRKAVENESRTAVITGNWEIEQAVRLPSNFTLVLEDCHLRMADGVYENMFVNEHHDTELGKTLAGRDRNISIVGRGEAILDGGTYNGLSERTQRTNGLPPIWKNNLILFTNVDGFHMSGFSCHNQRWWALNFIYCANGYVGNLDFRACDIYVDEDGTEHHGLKREKYAQVLVKNADGVDLRKGCHHVVIENLTGFTEDDTVALTALNGKMEAHFAVEGLPEDICHVEVRNIRSAAFCSNVRLLNQGGTKLHDILVDGVYDVGHQSPYMDRGGNALRLGDTHMYGDRHATKEETYNITLRNIVGAGINVLSIAGAIDNLVMQHIESANGARMLCDNRTE